MCLYHCIMFIIHIIHIRNMICIYVSTYDLNKCPLLSCFMCLMNFILEIGNLETAELVRHHAPVSMVAPQRRIPPGAMVMPPDWGTQWKFPVEDCRCWDQQSPCCQAVFSLRQGLQSKEVVMGKPWKNSANGKGMEKPASFESCFHFWIFWLLAYSLFFFPPNATIEL